VEELPNNRFGHDVMLRPALTRRDVANSTDVSKIYCADRVDYRRDCISKSVMYADRTAAAAAAAGGA